MRFALIPLLALPYMPYDCQWEKMDVGQRGDACRSACRLIQEAEAQCRVDPTPPIQRAQPCRSAKLWRSEYAESPCQPYYTCQ